MEWEEVEKILKEKIGFGFASPDECQIVYETAKRINAKDILELGVGRGTFTVCGLLWCRQNNGFMESIEIGGALFRDPSNIIKDLGLNPFWKITMEDDRTKVWEKNVDLLIIDSSHNYEHTKFELDKYTPFLRDSGEVLLHDAVHKAHGRDITTAVIEFILSKNPSFSWTDITPKRLAWNYQLYNTWNGVGRLYKTLCEAGVKSG